MMCPAVTAESLISFKASSSLHVAVKPSPAASNLAHGIGTSESQELGSPIASYL
jgi:hypothetical protein